MKTDGKTRKQAGARDEVFERYNGVTLNDAENVSMMFIDKVIKVLNKNGLETTKTGINFTNNKALMDKSMNSLVLSLTKKAKCQNTNLFQRRLWV